MPAYRDDHQALLSQVEALRADLKRAEADSAELDTVRAQLERKQKELAKLERKLASVEGTTPPKRRTSVATWAVALTLAALALVSWLFVNQPVDETSSNPQQATNTWFERVRSHCNPLEVAVTLARDPAPKGVSGSGYEIACWAIAGNIERAKQIVDKLAPGDRAQALGVVFGVADPIADSGDDKAAGPIMEMILEYVPTHYQAEYHAGMSEYALGQHDRARPHLEHFLSVYKTDDGFRRNALEVVGRYPKDIAAPK